MIHYYFEKEGKVVGPLSLQVLGEKNIRSTTLIWRHGFSSWTPAAELEELRSLFSKIPPPLPSNKPEQPTEKKAVISKIALTPKAVAEPRIYDDRYRKETEATTTGIFLMLTPLLFIIFYKRAFYNSDYFSYIKMISVTGAIIIRIIAVTWVMRVARHQNRDTGKWGIAAVLLPAISMIIIGLCRKLYNANEWKQHLYNEKRQKSNAYFHAVISERY